MARFRLAPAIVLLVMAVPAFAQQTLPSTQSLPNDTCAECFAFLEFAAQEPVETKAPAYPAACVEYVAEYMGCLNYGDPQAPTDHGRPALVKAPSQTQSRSTVNRAADMPSVRPVARQ